MQSHHIAVKRPDRGEKPSLSGRFLLCELIIDGLLVYFLFFKKSAPLRENVVPRRKTATIS